MIARTVVRKLDKMRKLILIFQILIITFSCSEINQTEKLEIKVDSLKIKNDSLVKLLMEKKTESNYWYNKYDGEMLLQNGIRNPQEYIDSTLRNKTELIPLKATLGGRMHFGKIQLLGSDWLIAEFDDGHIQGKGIYKFALKEKKELEFELLHYKEN